jgi:hypothetical protein
MPLSHERTSMRVLAAIAVATLVALVLSNPWADPVPRDTALAPEAVSRPAPPAEPGDRLDVVRNSSAERATVRHVQLRYAVTLAPVRHCKLRVMLSDGSEVARQTDESGFVRLSTEALTLVPLATEAPFAPADCSSSPDGIVEVDGLWYLTIRGDCSGPFSIGLVTDSFSVSSDGTVGGLELFRSVTDKYSQLPLVDALLCVQGPADCTVTPGHPAWEGSQEQLANGMLESTFGHATGPTRLSRPFRPEPGQTIVVTGTRLARGSIMVHSAVVQLTSVTVWTRRETAYRNWIIEKFASTRIIDDEADPIEVRGVPYGDVQIQCASRSGDVLRFSVQNASVRASVLDVFEAVGLGPFSLVLPDGLGGYQLLGVKGDTQEAFARNIYTRASLDGVAVIDGIHYPSGTLSIGKGRNDWRVPYDVRKSPAVDLESLR